MKLFSILILYIITIAQGLRDVYSGSNRYCSILQVHFSIIDSQEVV